jgi:hypothetical protein
MEFGGLEEVQRRRLGELADDVWDEKQPADQTQNDDAVGNIERLHQA